MTKRKVVLGGRLLKTGARVRVATHGAGVGTVILALDTIPTLSPRVVHQFASDDDPLVQQVLAYNYPDIKGHGDCTMHYAADTDLYYCISQCTSLGARVGISISELIATGMEYIKEKLPSAFVLVSDAHRDARQPSNVINILSGIRGADGRPAYDTQWRLLHVNVHGGLPQARPQGVVTGTLSTKGLFPFEWPRSISAMPLDSLLDPRDDNSNAPCMASKLELGMQEIWAARRKKPEQTCVIDLQASCAQQRRVMGEGMSPGLTAGSEYYFVTSRGLMMTTTEMLKLQGIHPTRLRVPSGVTEKQFAAMVRASVAVPLLARVTLNLCKAIGIVARKAKAARR